MQSPPTRFVLFADVLGFKKLVLEHRVPKFENLDFRDPDVDVRGGSNVLGRGFRAFHGAVYEASARIPRAKADLMVFSDSVFLATERAGECMRFAAELMRHTIELHCPLRMGIGFGTFVNYGFSFQQTPFLTFSSSQFFGSAVIHATESEKAIMGLRIAIHESAAARMRDTNGLADYLTDLPEPRCSSLRHEWNYLMQPELESPEYADAQAKALQMHVNRMAQAAPAEPRVQLQYSETLAAYKRWGVE